MHLYEKATGMSRWLLGLVILRELLVHPSLLSEEDERGHNASEAPDFSVL